MAARLLLILGLVALAAAQRCQNYWNGRAPFCAPGGCASDAYKWWGIVSDSGNGDECWTGQKRLCQCLAPGSLDACVPTLPPKETKQLNGLITICNNGCSVYVCGVNFVKFWKRDEVAAVYPCDEYPDQPHCQPHPDPDPPTPPPNDISSTPLTPDQVRIAFSQVPVASLSEILRSLGENTDGKSQADLVNIAWNQFSASMGNLDIGQVNAAASFATFEQGLGSWVYYSDKIQSG
ncbi:MAG: hypothetical protein Q9220_004073 [cf. Caloplaca sp. 1 TL-2023]